MSQFDDGVGVFSDVERMVVRDRELQEVCERYGELGRSLMQGFKTLSWGPREAAAYLATATRVKSSVIEAAADDEALDDIVRARKELGVGVDYEKLRDEGVHVTSVHEVLDEADKQFLRDDFAGVTVFNFTATDKSTRGNPHAVAAVAKKTMALQVFRQIPKNARVLEVGADPMAAVKRGVDPEFYRGCCPMLDAKDRERWNSKMRAIEVMLRRTGRGALKGPQRRTAEIITKDPHSLFFFEKVQLVKWRCEYVVSIAGNWNIPMSVMPEIMHNVGAKCWYATFDRVDGLPGPLTTGSGVTRGTKMRWEADGPKDIASFWFEGCYSQPYRHRLSVAREYMNLTSREYVVGGREYVVTPSRFSTGSQLVVQCVDAGILPHDVESMGSCRAVTDESMLRVTVDVRNWAIADGMEGAYEPRTFEVEEDIFGRALADRMIAGTKGDVMTVLRFARANRVTVLHNGVRVSNTRPLEVDVFRYFAQAVEILAQDMLRADVETRAAMGSSLKDGGYTRLSGVSGVIARVKAALTGSGTLLGAISERIRELVSGADSSQCVKLQRVPKVIYEQPMPVVHVNAGPKPEVPMACYCAERSMVARLLRGELGHLSPVEIDVLQGYAGVLTARKCTRCVSARAALEECELSDEEFFDALSEVAETSESSCDDDFASSEVRGSGGSDTDATSITDTVERKMKQAYVPVECVEVSDDALPNTTPDEEAELLKRVEGLVRGEEVPTLPKTRVRCAVEEWATILRLQMQTRESEIRNLFSKVIRYAEDIDQKLLDSLSDNRNTRTLIRVDYTGRLLSCDADDCYPTDYQRVYDYLADEFRTVYVDAGRAYIGPRSSSVVYADSHLKIWNQPAILKNLCPSLASGSWLDGPEPRVPFVNGVWGCGKTTGTAAQCVNDNAFGKRMFLSATRAGVESLREKLFDSKSSEDAIRWVRSYDSVCVWGKRGVDVEELVLDEAAALHAGQLLFVLAIYRPKRVRAFGDFKQMGFVPFCNGVSPKWGSIEPFCDVMGLGLTHRCRLSIVAGAVETYQDMGMDLAVCVNCCDHIAEDEEGGLEVIEISDLSQVPIDKDTYYITITQKTKSDLRALCRAAGLSVRHVEENVRTAAESQGATKEKVIIVREDKRKKPGSLYHEVFRANVAVSRGKQKVEYYTLSDEEDAYRAFAKRSRMDVYRDVVRENSLRYAKEIEKIGKEKFFEKFYKMEPLRYVDGGVGEVIGEVA